MSDKGIRITGIELEYHLLINLRDRMEYNEKTTLWSLKGPITREEYKAFNEAIDVLGTCISREGTR